VCALLPHTLLLSAAHRKAPYTQHTAVGHLHHLLLKQLTTVNLLRHSLSNVYDVRRPTRDRAGADVTRAIHTVRAGSRVGELSRHEEIVSPQRGEALPAVVSRRGGDRRCE
jgi:hypothetical protein